ncbi:MAG: periplasmic heavy metal sensor [Thiovulaceae bacterium]|nr:periplasmic heavy metal sensor [Sulfurimonadaceae bacterium]
MKFFTLFLLLATLLFADSDKHEHKEHHLSLDMSYLHLTSEQHAQARTIAQTYKQRHKAFHHLKKETRKAVSKLFEAESFDAAAFIRLTAELNQRAAEIQAEFFSRMHAILSPSQKKRFVDYMEEWEVE